MHDWRLLASGSCARPFSGSLPAWQDSGLPRRASERRGPNRGPFKSHDARDIHVKHGNDAPDARRSPSSCLYQRKSWDLHCLLWAPRTWASSCRCRQLFKEIATFQKLKKRLRGVTSQRPPGALLRSLRGLLPSRRLHLQRAAQRPGRRQDTGAERERERARERER